MLTMTSIANAMPCPRKPILQSLVRVAGPPTKAVLYGTIQHGLLQSSLSEQSFEDKATRIRLDETLDKEEMRLEVWGAGMSVQDIKVDLGTRAGRGFEVFGSKWVGPEPGVSHRGVDNVQISDRLAEGGRASLHARRQPFPPGDKRPARH
jgi:DNA replication ATP-dependent helicase Dna2